MQCFSSKNVLAEHKEVCLSINGAKSLRLGKEKIEFKNYFKQIPVPFKIYTDFGCILNSVESYEGSFSKTHQNHFPYSFTHNLVLMTDLVSQLLFTEVKIVLINLLKQFLKSMNTAKK